MEQLQLDNFINSYLAMWHEADRERRHALVRSLWTEDAENISRTFSIRGMDQVIARVDRAHNDWVAGKGFVFRPQGSATAHHHLVKFSWEMLPAAGGALEARGLDIFVLAQDGRIRSLYQFGEPLPAS